MPSYEKEQRLRLGPFFFLTGRGMALGLTHLTPCLRIFPFLETSMYSTFSKTGTKRYQNRYNPVIATLTQNTFPHVSSQSALIFRSQTQDWAGIKGKCNRSVGSDDETSQLIQVANWFELWGCPLKWITLLAYFEGNSEEICFVLCS